MELKSLYTVKKILETESYQKAAQALNYAQSTITFQIHQLENELSVKLFEKSGKRMILTQEGRALLPYIDQILQATEAMQHFHDRQEALYGNLRIALPESLATYKMQPVLRAFKTQAPGVKLSLQVMNCYAIYDRLLDGDIDLAIHYDIRPYPGNFEIRNLASYSLAMVASPNLSTSAGDLITPNQRKDLCHIINDRNALYLKILDVYLKQKNIHLEEGIEVWSIEAVKRSVMSNLGIAFLPRFTVEEELQQGRLKELPLDMPEVRMTAVCAWKKNKWKSPAMEYFLKLLEQRFPDSSSPK